MSPPFRWQAGKVWQGVGSAVRLPPRSPPWWILASRPSAPWLLTGIPDAIGPLSSRSTLAGPSVLPFQARALSSASAGMTGGAQCQYVGGVLLFPQLHTLQHGWIPSHCPFAGRSWEGKGLCHTPPAHSHTRGTRILLPSIAIIGMTSGRGIYPIPALASKPLQPRQGLS